MRWLYKLFSIHDWTEWKVIENRRFGFSGWKTVQQRKCKICNKRETKVDLES